MLAVIPITILLVAVMGIFFGETVESPKEVAVTMNLLKCWQCKPVPTGGTLFGIFHRESLARAEQSLCEQICFGMLCAICGLAVFVDALRVVVSSSNPASPLVAPKP